MWRHNGEMAIYEQVNGLSADTKSAGTLLLDSPTSRLREINICCLSHGLTVHDPMDCSPPGSSVHGLLQARILEWLAIPFSRGSSRPRDWTWVSCIATHLQCGRVGFYSWVGKISWRIPWTLQSLGSQRVGHYWATITHTVLHCKQILYQLSHQGLPL